MLTTTWRDICVEIYGYLLMVYRIKLIQKSFVFPQKMKCFGLKNLMLVFVFFNFLEFLMKKNLIALAVLAASGVASAQSSVTLYGIADVWVGSAKSGDVRNTKLDSGGVSGSRFGFMGSEDLGGGLKANFVLESGFNIDTGANTTSTNVAGATTTNLFSRQSYVGFSGNFGAVKLGKMFTAYDDINGATNAAFDSVLSPQNKVWLSGNFNANPGNSVYYSSPSLSGFSGAVSYSLGENKNVPVVGVSAGKIASFHAKYEGGPIYAGVAYQTEKATGAAVETKFTRVNGSYDLGVVKLLAGYGHVANYDVVGTTVTNVGKTNDYQIGADFPLSSALTISGGFAQSKTTDRSVGLADTKRTGLGLAASYSLSKRTSLYGGVQSSKQKQNGFADVKSDLYAVGVRHAF